MFVGESWVASPNQNHRMCPESQARDTFLRSIQFKPTAEDGHMKHALKSEDVTLKR
jgi:hypothetical protein